MLAAGFEMCEAGFTALDGIARAKRVRFEDQDEECALHEPNTRPHLLASIAPDVADADIDDDDNDMRLRLQHLVTAIGDAQVSLLRGLGALEPVLRAMPVPPCMVVTTEDDPAVMSLEDFIETDILLTLDSGCCDHICDIADAPGYAQVLHPSAGSRRGQRFIVGNGARVPNAGQVRLKMQSKDEAGVLMSSVFQVAEVTRPLMSVSRICDQDMVCIFEKTHARIVDKHGTEVSRFERDGGLYTCTMKLRRPDPLTETNSGSGFARPA